MLTQGLVKNSADAANLFHRLSITFLTMCVSAWLTSCASLGERDAVAPETQQKQDWSNGTDALLVDGVIRPEWWRDFNDPFLDTLITQAITNNKDLQVLAARTSVAEANIKVANSTRLPTIDAALGHNIQKTEGQASTRQSSYASALAWEIDIWGKLKKGVDAQEAGFHASEAQWRAGYLTLVSDVASTYFQIRQFDEQIKQQKLTVNSGQQIADIYTSQIKEGIAPKTRLLQQEAEVSRLQTDLLELQRLRQLSENALATLVGVSAGELSVPLGGFNEEFAFPTVPAGLPSDLLNKRPDIIASQYRVLQSYDLEGQASLARLPSVSLTSNVGNSSTELSDLLNIFTAGLTPRVSIPIFDPGVKARYRVSQAESNLADEQYRATVIRAFEEVENALTNLANHKLQYESLQLQQEKLNVVAAQTQARLNEGMITQLEVFESERSYLAAKQRLLANQQLILSDTVELYKALGGGWPDDDVFSRQEP